MEHLPLELLVSILVYLPRKSRLVCRLVSQRVKQAVALSFERWPEYSLYSFGKKPEEDLEKFLNLAKIMPSVQHLVVSFSDISAAQLEAALDHFTDLKSLTISSTTLSEDKFQHEKLVKKVTELSGLGSYHEIDCLDKALELCDNLKVLKVECSDRPGLKLIKKNKAVPLESISVRGGYYSQSLAKPIKFDPEGLLSLSLSQIKAGKTLVDSLFRCQQLQELHLEKVIGLRRTFYATARFPSLKILELSNIGGFEWQLYDSLDSLDIDFGGGRCYSDDDRSGEFDLDFGGGGGKIKGDEKDFDPEKTDFKDPQGYHGGEGHKDEDDHLPGNNFGDFVPEEKEAETQENEIHKFQGNHLIDHPDLNNQSPDDNPNDDDDHNQNNDQNNDPNNDHLPGNNFDGFVEDTIEEEDAFPRDTADTSKTLFHSLQYQEEIEPRSKTSKGPEDYMTLVSNHMKTLETLQLSRICLDPSQISTLGSPLKNLSFSQCKFVDDWSSFFEGLHHLRSLSMYFSPFLFPLTPDLPFCNTLVELKIPIYPETLSSLEQFILACPHLRTLETTNRSKDPNLILKVQSNSLLELEIENHLELKRCPLLTKVESRSSDNGLIHISDTCKALYKVSFSQKSLDTTFWRGFFDQVILYCPNFCIVHCYGCLPLAQAALTLPYGYALSMGFSNQAAETRFEQVVIPWALQEAKNMGKPPATPDSHPMLFCRPENEARFQLCSNVPAVIQYFQDPSTPITDNGVLVSMATSLRTSGRFFYVTFRFFEEDGDPGRGGGMGQNRDEKS